MTALRVEGLGVARGATLLLRGASFAARGGELIGVVGPNGAGKSTLLRAIAGLERAAAGLVAINGDPVPALTSRERARRVAYLPQARPVHWAMTAEAVVKLGRFAFGEPLTANAGDDDAVARALEAAEAAMLRTRIVPTLSGGEQARVHLARVFAAEAPVMLLDEPTAALDISRALKVMAILKAKADEGAVVLAALHDFALARRFCDRLIVLSDGALVADAAPDVALNDATLASVFAVESDGGHFRPSGF